jgi:DnaJ like chaperone protein
MKNILDNFFRWLKDVTYLKDLIIRAIVLAPLGIAVFFLWFISIPILLWYIYAKFGNNRIAGCRCTKCNKLNDCNDKFCIQCGASLAITNSQSYSQTKAQHHRPEPSKKKKCTHCGLENEPDAKFCISCGKSSFTTETINREDETIAGYIVALLAHIAKGDDVVSNNEAALISQFLNEMSMGDDHVRSVLKDIFNRAKDKTVRDYQLISQKLYKEILTEMDSMSERNEFLLMIAMYFMALVYVDGRLNNKQNIIVTEILKNLRFTDARIREVHEQFQETQHADPKTVSDKDYDTLNCKPSDSDDVIKKAYRDLAKQYHPDTLQGKNLPEAIMLLATEKFKEINAAYEKIKKLRGIR